MQSAVLWRVTIKAAATIAISAIPLAKSASSHLEIWPGHYVSGALTFRSSARSEWKYGSLSLSVSTMLIIVQSARRDHLDKAPRLPPRQWVLIFARGHHFSTLETKSILAFSESTRVSECVFLHFALWILDGDSRLWIIYALPWQQRD